MTKLIVANWKSNPNTVTEALKLARASDFKNVVIAPAYPSLEQVEKLNRKASLGAQNTFWEDGGPYTGEVSVSQLCRLKVKYVIVGHSERRLHLQETDEVINKKVKLVLSSGLKVILCVGESLKVRREGALASQRHVARQLDQDLKGITSSRFKLANLIIAYEPIWAIGTSKPDKPGDATAIISSMRRKLFLKYDIRRRGEIKFLYGGSINARNAFGFLSRQGIDGALVGGASLNPKSFKAIIKARDSI